MTKYITTLNDIRKHSPCSDGWTKLLKHLGKTDPDDEPIGLLTILESNGLDDALWCLRALSEEHDNAVRLLVCDLVEPAMQFVDDPQERPQKALKAARDFANGLISREDRAAARAAAWAAGDAARAEQERTLRNWLSQ